MGHSGLMREGQGKKRRIVVIGAGLVGLCVAWYARAAGHEVVVLEGGTPEMERCSLGNAGMVVPSHIVPLASPGAMKIALRSLVDRRSPLRIKPRLDPSFLSWSWDFWRSATREHVERSAPALRDLSLLSRRCYEELAQEWGNPFALRKHGLRVLCSTKHGFEEEAETAKFAEALGIPAIVMGAAETRRAEPGLTLSVAGSVFFPLDCDLLPSRLMASFIERLAAEGVTVRWSAPVRGWRVDGGRINAVETPTGEVTGDEFVLAAGVWSESLARKIGLHLPLQGGKGYSITLEQPPELPHACLILSEARIAITPMEGSLRIAGTMELAGLEHTVDSTRLATMLSRVSNFLPAFGAERLRADRPWVGLRPCSPDGMPYIGRSRRFGNLVVCTGHAMMGVSLAPASGRIVADLIGGREPPIPLAAFAPERFA